MKVVLLPDAQEALEEIADPLFSDIIRRLDSLKEYPELGSPMSGEFSGYRSTVAGFFRIVYRLLPRSVIEIAYIRDCRRRPLD